MWTTDKKPSEHDADIILKHSEFMAKRIAALTPGTPSGVLACDVLLQLQKDPVLKPFWYQEKIYDDIKPVPDIEFKGSQLVQASFDIKVGNEMVIIGQDDYVKYEDMEAKENIIPPNHLAMIKSREYLYMPPFLAGSLVTPVDLAMSGASNISTMLDPSFEGFLLLSIFNNSSYDINIKRGMKVSRILFHMVAYIDQLHTGIKYSHSHEKLMTLKSIIDERVLRMDSNKTVHSKKIKELLKRI